MIAFLWTPELVENLLSFLDAPSILNLARAHNYTVHVLQKTLVWEKMIRRNCPFSKEEEDWSLVDTIVERKREQVRALVGLLELLEDRKDHHLNLLKLTRERFSLKVGSQQNYINLSDSKNAPGRLEICQKIYTTGFSGQKFYTLKVRKLRLFLLKKKQRKCINISYFSSFFVRI